MAEKMATTKMTEPQRLLLERMYDASPTRLHRVGDLGQRCSVLHGLVRLGLAELAQGMAGPDLWRGRLTSAGRALVKQKRDRERVASEATAAIAARKEPRT